MGIGWAPWRGGAPHPPNLPMHPWLGGVDMAYWGGGVPGAGARLTWPLIRDPETDAGEIFWGVRNGLPLVLTLVALILKRPLPLFRALGSGSPPGHPEGL